MTDKRTIINKETLVPIGLLISVCCAVWYLSSLNSRVIVNTGRVNIVEVKVEEMPSRNEFDGMKEDIKEIKVSVKELTDYIIIKK